jgi:transposase
VGTTELFCDIDDFCKIFIPSWLKSMLPEEKPTRNRSFTMSPAEVMTILILFHRSGQRNFKQFYNAYVPAVYRKAFPERVSYNRFIELSQSVLIPLCAYLNTRRVTSKGIAFVDSTPLRVCHNKRINRNKVFKGIAERGKNSTGWFYGFKLHLIIDDEGNLVSFFVTPGNVDDRKGLKKTARHIKGKLFGDRGYISKALREELWDEGIRLITNVRRNMKKIFLEDMDKILLRKRSLIETVNDQLKNISQIEHSRHRSITGFMVNLVCSLIAYSQQPKKPSLKIRRNNLTEMIVIGENNTARSINYAV